MSIRPIVKMGDERLLRVSAPIEPAQFGSAELRALAQDMLETMRAEDGAGLAAPQIGVNWQIIVFGSALAGQLPPPNPRYPDAAPVPLTVLCNPSLTPLGDEEEDGWEGCLSIPGLRAVVPRWRRIRYSGWSVEGEPIEREAEGFHARVVQHEHDHLMGILYPMRIRDFSRFGFTEVLFPDLPD